MTGGSVRRYLVRAVLLAAVLSLPGTIHAATITIDFESFLDSDPVGTIPPATFTNAVVLTAGVSLNELELPPASGVNVAYDFGGPMEIVFSTPILSFSGYFTYGAPLTLQAFTAGNVLVDDALSSFGNNMLDSGEPLSAPNELLAVSGANIARVLITADPGGGSFVVDDVTFDTQATTVPEPSSMLLLGGGLLGLLRRRRRAARSRE